MPNDARGSSIWPVLTVVLGITMLGLAGWDVMLGNQNKLLDDRVKALESRAAQQDKQVKDAKAAAFKERQRARAAAKAGGGEAKPATRRAPKTNAGG